MGRLISPQAHLLTQRFADNLIVLRDRADQSQETISLRSGLHRTQISLLERGLRTPRLDTILKVAGAVEVEPYELLAGMEWQIIPAPVDVGSYVAEREN